VSLTRGFYQTLSPRAKEEPSIELDLAAQLFDELLVLSDSLIMKLGRLIERGPELFNLLIVDLGGLIERRLELLKLPAEPVQEIVAFTGIGRP
jgi:hypothetical protein